MQASRNRMKTFYRVLDITTFFLVLTCMAACSGATFIIPTNSEVFYSKEELADVYWAHKADLDEVAEIVLASDAFRQRIIDGHEDDWEIRSDSVKSDFPEEDWNQIVDLFEKIRPLMIMRSLRANDDVVYIDFPRKKVDGHDVNVSLYYFKNAETAEYYKNYIWVGDLEHLDGYWYIGEHIYDR